MRDLQWIIESNEKAVENETKLAVEKYQAIQQIQKCRRFIKARQFDNIRNTELIAEYTQEIETLKKKFNL